jgi:hypothetical protein
MKWYKSSAKPVSNIKVTVTTSGLSNNSNDDSSNWYFGSSLTY